jgi:hypothetical protein
MNFFALGLRNFVVFIFTKRKFASTAEADFHRPEHSETASKFGISKPVGVVAQTGRGSALVHRRMRWHVLTAEVGHAARKVAWPQPDGQAQ